MSYQTPQPNWSPVADDLLAMVRSRLFLTVGEFAELYRCDERTARRGIERGEVPAVRVGSTIRIPVAALLRMAGLEDALESREAEPASPAIAPTPPTPLKATSHGNFHSRAG
jgi:excisionase family DNA binding protein